MASSATSTRASPCSSSPDRAPLERSPGMRESQLAAAPRGVAKAGASGFGVFEFFPFFACNVEGFAIASVGGWIAAGRLISPQRRRRAIQLLSPKTPARLGSSRNAGVLLFFVPSRFFADSSRFFSSNRQFVAFAIYSDPRERCRRRLPYRSGACYSTQAATDRYRQHSGADRPVITRAKTLRRGRRKGSFPHRRWR